jgi:hypothetical protein
MELILVHSIRQDPRDKPEKRVFGQEGLEVDYWSELKSGRFN